VTLKIETFGLTDTGMLRQNNEDSFLVEDDLNLYLVADGMGGHAAGEIASHLAVESIREFIQKSAEVSKPTWPFPTPKEFPLPWQRLMASIMAANGMIYRHSRENRNLAGMGTTVVAILLRDDEAIYAHVGDSRLYLLRNGQFYLKTEDHSWIQEQINAGSLTAEEALRHPLRNVITRALGGASVVSVDIASMSLEPGDLLLLCTDGLTTMLEDEMIASLLREGGSLQQQANRLIETANKMGGHDNTSVVLVRIRD